MTSRVRLHMPLHYALCLVLALAPLTLLVDINARFYLDWQNHLWHISYFAEYFKQHRSFPISLNTDPVIGMMYPVFYGVIFFPALGLLTNVTGVALAVRIFCVAAVLLQFGYVYALVYRVTRSRLNAVVVATLFGWAIYPITNLYNRSALTEFGATLLLSCSVCSWFFVVLSENISAKFRHLMFCAFYYTLACLTHPITAVYGAISLVILIVLTGAPLLRLPRSEKFQLLGATTLATLLTALAVSPWVYVTTQFVNRLFVHFRMERKNLEYYDFIDNILTRIAPFPVDPRSLAKGMDIITPYLDAQINLPMFFLLLGSLTAYYKFPEARRRIKGVTGLIAISIVAFGICVTWSTLEGRALAPVFFTRYLQLAYRLITYANLFLLTGLLGTFMILDVKSPRAKQMFSIIIAGCLALSGSSMMSKVLHGYLYTTAHEGIYNYEKPDKAELLKMPDTFYGFADYMSPLHLNQLPEEQEKEARKISLGVLSGRRFGEPAPFNFSIDKSRWVQTSVLSFPWNRLVVDGRELADSEMADLSGFLAFWMESGEHKVQFSQRPDPVWVNLRSLSFWVVIAWCVGLVAWVLLDRLVPGDLRQERDLSLAVNAPV